ncbi:hypothetical protein QUA70_12300 [Microcoleus sp. LAD1_D5]|uniref:hypothetical protein n=1 Tax=unclassified Microcoleus TaxID=2642155 RepID=UPI002FCFCD6C
MTQRILHGDKHNGFFIKDLGGNLEEANSVKPLLKKCDEFRIDRVSVAYSGLYYEKREAGWFLTSDTEQCDATHGLPSEGRLIKI